MVQLTSRGCILGSVGSLLFLLVLGAVLVALNYPSMGLIEGHLVLDLVPLICCLDDLIRVERAYVRARIIEEAVLQSLLHLLASHVDFYLALCVL